MSGTRSRAAKRPRTQTPAPAATAAGVLVGGVSGDEAVRMLQRMHQMDHLHDLHMYAPDDNGGLQLVTAHRLVMAAASERLEKTVARREGGFKEGQPEAPLRFDEGKFKGSMDACELRAIVSHAYGDAELRVAHEKLVGLSAAAHFVGMDALSELSAKKAIEGLQPSNAALTLQQAKQRGVQRVREASMAMVLKEFDTVCETEGFIRQLDVDLVCEVIERDELRVEGGEEVVFEAVLRWLGAGVAGRGGAEATRVLKLVRFPLMDGLYLDTKVAKCDAACVAGLEVLQKLYVEAVQCQAISLGNGAAGVEAAFEAGVVERSVRTRARARLGLDAGKMEVVKTMETGHEEGIWRMVEVGEWVVTSEHGSDTFKVWDQQGWTCLKAVDTDQDDLWSVTECGGMLATGGGDGSIKLWQPEMWTWVRTLEGHTSVVWDLAVHGDWLLSGSEDRTVCVWDRTSWECLRVVQTGHTGGVYSLAVHDGKFYCGGGYHDPTIRVIDTTTWASVGVMEGHTSTVQQLVVREGKLFSCSSDNTIKCWSTGEGRACEQTLEGHTAGVNSMAMCGDKVVSGSVDKTVRVWGMDQGTGRWQCERVLQGHSGSVFSVMCTRNGRRLLTSGYEGELRVWGDAA